MVDETAPTRRIEPWPLALMGALALMIGVCLAFYWVAHSHPDPDVRGAGAKPGLQQEGANAQ